MQRTLEYNKYYYINYSHEKQLFYISVIDIDKCYKKIYYSLYISGFIILLFFIYFVVYKKLK